MDKKKLFWIVVLVICVAVLIYLYASGRDQTGSTDVETGPTPYATGLAENATGALLVDFDNDVSQEQVERVARRHGLKLRPNSRFSLDEQLYRSRARRDRDLLALLRRLRQEPLVERAELDVLWGLPPIAREFGRLRPADDAPGGSFPNDPKYRYQWHLDQINMPRGWRRGSGQGVIVAVIDTGVAYKDHGRFHRVPDLANTEFVPGYDFVNKHAHPLDDHGHGTHVAGTIAQSTNNGVGVAGTAYRARIMPLKVLSSRGFGSVADIAEAIRFAADNGAKVINMSLGSSRPSKIMESAVTYAYRKGVTVVCAAGNDGRGKVGYPAAYTGALAVAATQYDRSTTFYSNWGREIDVAAPGGNTRVDQNNDGMPDGVLQNTIIPGNPTRSDYLLFMGTSMASPHAAGAAALVVESGVTDPDAVERVLEKTARHPAGKKRDDHHGAGIIDVGQALAKTTTDWGAHKLGLAGLLALLLFGRLGARGRLGVRARLGMAAGIVLGSGGLFVLSWLGARQLLPPALAQVATTGLPAWDAALLGPAGHGNPLFYSALLPVGLTIALYSLRRLRGLLAGLAVGVAAHLLFHLPFSSVDITWIPNGLGLDQLWLALNAGLCLALAHVVALRR